MWGSGEPVGELSEAGAKADERAVFGIGRMVLRIVSPGRSILVIGRCGRNPQFFLNEYGTLAFCCVRVARLHRDLYALRRSSQY